MAENTRIEWCHHTYNPWVGCTKISPACDHCYAEGWSKRAGRDVWGPHAARERTKTQGNPIKWNKALEGTGRRERVFVASLADVFDNHKSIQQEWRDALWHLIRDCPNLDFLLLTKRPQNIAKYLPDDWGCGYANVWLGTTVENQTTADQRIPHLLSVPAVVRFLSCEPLLGPVDLNAIYTAWHFTNCLDGFRYHHTDRGAPSKKCTRIDWVITGGESGPNYRPVNPDWFRSLRDQCAVAGTAFLFKQWEGKTQSQIKAKGRLLDGVLHDGYPKGKA